MTERIHSAVHACLEWAGGLDPRPVLEPRTLLFLLAAHLDAGAHDPGDWSTADVHDIARTVRYWDQTPTDLRATWLTWCDFLVEEGLLLSSESPRRLRGAIAAVDLSPEGPPGPAYGAAVEEAARPLLDRLGVGEGTGPEPLCPVVPAPSEDLDAAAHRCRPLADAARLAAWVGEGKDLRSDGDGGDELAPADAAGAAAALGRTPDEVRALFAVARHAGLLRTTYTRVLPGRSARAWAEGVPGAVADGWADALLTMAGHRGMTTFLLLTDLFAHGEARTPGELVGVCGSGAAPAGEDPGRHVRRVLGVLASLGAVEPAAAGRFRVTRLGDHFMVRQLRQSGAEVLVAPPLAGMDAEDVLALVDGGRPVDTEGLLERWLAARETESAVCDLFEAADAPDAWHRRERVAGALSALDEDLSPVLQLYVHHPVLGGWARGLRDAPPSAEPLSHQAVWAVLDGYAIRFDAGRPLPEQDRERYAGCAEEFVRAVWLTGHPVADTVLDRLSDGALGAPLAEAAGRVRSAPALY
ncbi:hypothetical protein ACFWTE_03780 [Nocardiopsis sp. NPDC058631]|uniref:hypothetical protein n=1 Tax=Nocardiopsis sp. NPDC058631 TaxID=3346566 RepID=UPI0036625759